MRRLCNKKDATHAQVEFIEGYYNRKRSHSTINNKIPAKVVDAFFERTKPISEEDQISPSNAA